jgi:exopolysaccharide biosynthesis polyprenyl glycosylphosphotransferase
VRKSDRAFIAGQIAADMLAVPLAVLVTWYLRAEIIVRWLPRFDHPLRVYTPVIPWVALIWAACFQLAELYRPVRRADGIASLTRRLKAYFMLAVALMAASYLVKMDYSRIILFLFIATAWPIDSLLRRGAAWLSGRLVPVKETPGVLVVGSGEYAEKVISSLRRMPGPRHVMTGIITEDGKPGSGEVCGVPVRGGIRDLPRLVTSLKVDEVVFASTSLDRTQIMEAINSVKGENVVFMVVTDLFQIASGAGSLEELTRMPVVEIGSARTGTYHRTAKRLLDIVLSLLLTVLLAPLMAVIWLLLLAGGKGDPLFRQKRVGKHGEPFTLYKFRTMVPRTGEYEVAPLKPGDPRVTRIGAFLRKTSLDELPQLFNVLRGSMSLVGPRPEMDFIVREYNAWQRRRLDVKPGITGLWQVMGRKDLPLHDNLEYDFYYIRNQSLMLDIAILLRTVYTVLAGRGAY